MMSQMVKKKARIRFLMALIMFVGLLLFGLLQPQAYSILKQLLGTWSGFTIVGLFMLTVWLVMDGVLALVSYGAAKKMEKQLSAMFQN